MGALQRQADGRRRCLGVASLSVLILNQSKVEGMTREIYVEFVVQGNFIKATAIDAVTATEASIVGPANAPRETLAEAAARKLKYVMAKKR